MDTTSKFALGFVLILVIATLGLAMMSMGSGEDRDGSDNVPSKPPPPEPEIIPEPTTRHTIIYDENGTIWPSDKGYSYFYREAGETVPYIEPDSRARFVFKGWMCKGQLWNFDDPVKGDMILVPKWSEHYIMESNMETWTLTDTIGDDWKNWNNVINWNDGSTSPVPAETNSVSHTYDTATHIVTVISYNGSETITSSVKGTFYPSGGHYNPPNSWDITFFDHGRNEYSKVNVKEGSRIPGPRMPVQDGEQFLGWYLQGKEWDFNEPIYFKKNLYAKWKKDASYKREEIKPVVEITERTGGIILDASKTVGAAHYEWYVDNKLVDVSESIILSPELGEVGRGYRVTLKVFSESRSMGTWHQTFLK